MERWNRLKFVKGLFVCGVAATVPVLTNGCSSASSIQQTLCCTEYKAGTDMAQVDFKVDASINGEFHAFAQAAGDITVVASAALDDATSACRQIAIDLGDDPKNAGANGKAGADLMNFWCAEAVGQINATFTATGVAKGTIKVDITP